MVADLPPTALPQRVYGTHLPTAFYTSASAPATFRGVASVPAWCRAEDVCANDGRILQRLRDGLQRLPR